MANFLSWFTRNNEMHKSGLPSRRYNHMDVRLKEGGGSALMNVDGSGVAVDFIFGPPANEIWVVDYLTLALVHVGNMAHNVWGSKAVALANGVLVFSNMKSVERQITEMNDNMDILQCFAGAKAGALGGGGQADPGFMNTVDYIAGRMEFETPFVLFGNDGDTIGFRIRDNLTDAQDFRASAHIRDDIEF